MAIDHWEANAETMLTCECRQAGASFSCARVFQFLIHRPYFVLSCFVEEGDGILLSSLSDLFFSHSIGAALSLRSLSLLFHLLSLSVFVIRYLRLVIPSKAGAGDSVFLLSLQ